MERLTLNRRQKTTGDKIDCIPAGDGLPVWTTISLDAKLPMMQNPKGSVILYTTKLGEPKHRCKQEYDFDLRDPNGQYISNEYQPLHDPHLRFHFNTQLMRGHLIKRGFISGDGKILCSLKEFNQYRQYLRHVHFLEIAKERKQELDARLTHSSDHRREVNPDKHMSRGSLVRRRLQQQREQDLNTLKRNINDKASKLENRLKAIREEMIARERKQREEAERRQMAVFKNQQESELRNLTLMKRWKNRDRLRIRLLEDRETQSKIQAELKCMEKWNARKEAQTLMLEKNNELLKQEDDERAKSINNRDQTINKKRDKLERKIEKLKQTTREEKQKRDEHYFKRLDEKLASGDYRIWTKRKERKRSVKRTFLSTWKLQDVLRTLEIPDKINKQGDPAYMMTLNDAIDDAVDMVVDQSVNDLEYQVQARDIVNDVITKVKNDLYPRYLLMLDAENNEENDAIKSKSVRFSFEETEIKGQLPFSCDDLATLKPVTEHILTPVASQLEIVKLEAEAIIGSPELSDKTSSVTFVETLLLRLLDDLNGGKLSKDEIMKLASYSMDIIQSAETDKHDGVIVEVPEEVETEGPYLAASSSSIIAKKMVDFTLSKILSDVQTGGVHPDDIASLTVSLMDNVAGCESGETASESDSALEAYIDNTLQRATSAATDPREDSPVCDAMLDDFMVSTLKKLIHDLEDESLTKEQMQQLAASVTEETRKILPQDISNIERQEDIQNVLHELLGKLQSGDIGFQAMYQVVFAIVYTYNTMKTPGIEIRFTELLKDLLFTVERKAANGELGDINVDIVHEATTRLSHSNLDSKQIESISFSLIGNDAVSICRDTTSSGNTNAAEIVAEVISKAKLKLEHAECDPSLQQDMETVAEAVINAVQGPCVSPTFVDVFINVLQELKQVVQSVECIDDMTAYEIGDLTDKIMSNDLSQDILLEIASSVARVMRSPVKSESSMAASLVVKDSLKEVLKDLHDGTLDSSFIREMVGTLKTCLSAAESRGRKTPSFINTLSSFLRHVLDQLTFKVQTGEMTEDDIAELSDLLKNKINNVDNTAEKELLNEDKTKLVEEVPKPSTPDITHVLHRIQYFIDNTEQTELTIDETRDLGLKLIECGKKLVKSFGDESSPPHTPCTKIVVDDVVEEVIRNLQLEIESGVLSIEALKEVTKVIIDSTSTSETANEVVSNTIRGIQRDVERGHPENIPSVPALNPTPSASTVASHIVMQTIYSIGKEMSSKGIPTIMISSLASTIVSDLSGENPLVKALPEEFQRFKPTLVNIVKCLKEDKVSESCAESMFCLILEKYKTCVLENQVEKQLSEKLSSDDLSLINALVVETLDNVRRSVTKGRMDNKAFSVPSMPHSEDTSMIANEIIDHTYMENIKRSIAAENAMPQEPKLPHENISFINTLVVETLDNVRRSVTKGRMDNKAFSIPSMAHSEDSSVIAIDLIDTCLDSIQRGVAAEKAMPKEPKHDLIDFILEIVTRLQAELEDGTISNLSMAHFYKAISDDSDDMKTLEVNASVNLTAVVSNIRRFREHSEFVHRILETYLIPERSSDEVFGDPLKAIEAILVNVSSEILTKFVKATLQTILMEIRSGSTPMTDRTPPAYVLRSASSIIAENVIKEVVSRIRHDMNKSIHKIHGTVCKQDIERAANRIINESPRVAARKSTDASVHKPDSRQSMSSTSKEVEDIVLETLHNIVSNLRFEQSMKSEKNSKLSQGASTTSLEIEDFVLGSLQSIIVDQQDKRSQMELGVEKTWSKYDGSSIELRSGESKEATTYVNEVLQNVLQEMKEEVAFKEEETSASGKESDLESYNVQTMILECLQRALFDTLAPDSLNAAAELYHQEDIKKILLESVTATITNIRDDRFSQHDIDTMYKACKRFFEEVDPEYVVENVDTVTPKLIVELMDQVKAKVEQLNLDNNTLANISTQLATLGMDSSPPDKTVSDHTTSDLSASSTYVNELVQDVITRMSAQLNDVRDAGQVSKSTSKDSGMKKDVNYNRQVSVTTVSSRTSVESIASSTGTLKEETPAKKSSTPAKGKQIDERHSSTKGKQRGQKLPGTGKKLLRRSCETRPVIRRSPMPSKTGCDQLKTDTVGVAHVKARPYVHHIQPQRQSSITKYVASEKSPKSSSSSKVHLKSGYSVKKATNKEAVTPTAHTNKALPREIKLSNKVQKHRPKTPLKRADEKNTQKRNPDTANVVDHPLELRSLCGSHRTKLSYKEIEEPSPTTDVRHERPIDN